ncbi:family 16 glycosylhydrolase [Silvibacterium sp.]|uniref:glycoside hydrolase family 16 protein n=1 Tax=Silvibacterium sp. TaxID=1964179 RepID=UPI0039E25C2C
MKSKCGMIAAWMLGAALAGHAGMAQTQTQEQLVWSDEFNGPAMSQPDPQNWTYDTGKDGWGNHELETYCSWRSSAAPCNTDAPNAYVGGDGYLHIIAHSLGNGVFTSARLKTKGLHSFLYGRIEARIQMPAGQGLWPAFWMLGDDIDHVPWPACGEIDIMESVSKTPTINYGSVHGTGFTGTSITSMYQLPGGAQFAEGFHTFGILWSPKEVRFYVDDPSKPYAIDKPSDLQGGGIWPFDTRKFFLLLNLAVGGDWPGAPGRNSSFPQEMLVDYVRVYSMPAAR